MTDFKFTKAICDHFFPPAVVDSSTMKDLTKMERRRENNAHRHALVIGYHSYTSQPINGQEARSGKDVITCQNSARRMARLLDTLFTVTLITDYKEPKKPGDSETGEEQAETLSPLQRVSGEIRAMLENSTSKDRLIIYYTGHGVANTDNQGKQDVSLMLPGGPSSFERGNFGCLPVSSIIEMARNAHFQDLVLVLDCCYGGCAGDFSNMPKNMCIITAGLQNMEVPSGAVELSVPGKLQSHWAIREADSKGEQLEESKTGFKRSMDDRQNYRYTYFSNFFIEAVCGGAANPFGIISLASIYQYVNESMGSNERKASEDWHHARPMMKSNLDHDIAISYIDNILGEMDLQNLWEFRQHMKADIKVPIPYPEGKFFRRSLHKYIKLGLMIRNGQSLTYVNGKPQLVDLYKFTFRGWHFWTLLNSFITGDSKAPKTELNSENM